MQYRHDLYFESAAMILTLITVGKTLEAYSKGKTTDAVDELIVKVGYAPKRKFKVIEKERRRDEAR